MVNITSDSDKEGRILHCQTAKTETEKMLHYYSSSALLRPICSLPSTKAQSFSSSQNAPSLLKFRTSYRDNLRYLYSLGIINEHTKFHANQSPESLLQILSTVSFLKTKGFFDSDIPRLAFLSPRIFSPEFAPADLEPVFDFLTYDLAASPDESRGLIICCPKILESNVQFCLRPTLLYLREFGVPNLNLPTNLNAHLLNTRIKKLQEKLLFLQAIGFSYQESAIACARFPAIFGYSIEHNLGPKFKYLREEMERSIDELKEFPQYFAFSLQKRIIPRHTHLLRRNIKNLPLNRMLLWCDHKFYAKWK